jgi:hypothetical protein
MRLARVLALGLAASLALALAPAPRAADAPGPLESTRRLIERLKQSGRGEVRVTQTSPDPTGGRARVDRGTLALEPPDRARLAFPATGEALTVRGDGGEWLQPAARQMLVLKPEQAAEAARAWEILLAGGRDRYAERRAGPGRYVLIPLESGSVDSASIRLDAHGLPARADLFTPAMGRVSIVFGTWKFTAARGAAAFTLRAPAGYEVVQLP